MEKGTNVDDGLVRLFLETADALETLGNHICEEWPLVEEPVFPGLAGIYYDAEKIYLYACKLAEQEFIGYEVKIDVYKKLEDFYTEDIYIYGLRTACVGNKNCG